MHYAFERYRNSIPQPAPQPFVSYLFFLPTFVVGPIHRAPAFFRDFQEKRFRAADFSEGLERILYGYVKIAFLGNYLISNQFQSFISGIDPVNEGLIEYLRMVRTALNLYVQFSGFSDIAIGYALLLGYRVIENFNFPYLSPNIAEFWKRWHISLTSWSRDYIYMPFLGLTRNPYVATCASFLVIGLWHEMSLRYVVWGLYHAAGVLFFQWLQRAKRRWKWFPKPKNPHARRLIHVFNVVLTLHFVWLSFVFVRHDDLGEALRVIAVIFSGW